MDLFDLNQQDIKINVYYKIIKNKYGVKSAKVYKDNEIEDLYKTQDGTVLNDQQKEGILNLNEIKKLETTWKLLTYKQYAAAGQASQIPGDKQHINLLTYKEIIIQNALKDWDLKDAKGIKVPYEKKLIEKLPEEIFAELYTKYREYIQPGADDLKKQIRQWQSL